MVTKINKNSSCPQPILNLQAAPQVIYLFGLAGAGKSYVGQLIAANSDYNPYEADQDLTPEMRAAIKNKQPFTDDMRDNYYALILQKIQTLLKEHSRIVVMQATYKQRHRDMLKRALGNNLALLEVCADQNVLVQRLIDRGDQVDPAYAHSIAKNFEVPNPSQLKIINNADDSSVIKQLNQLFAKTV